MNLRSLPRVLSAIAAAAFAGLPAHAETYTWLPKESAGPGLTYTWNLADNWSAPEFSYPMIAGDVANLNNNIEAAQTIDLNQSITIGVLNFGDEDGSHAFTLNSGLFGDALILDSGVVGMAAQINLSSAAKPINTINAPLILGTALKIDLGGTDVDNAQRLAINGQVFMNTQTITVTGGIYNAGTQLTFASGTLVGGPGSVIINNSSSPIVFNGTQPEFTGKIVVNGRSTGSNTFGLTNQPERLTCESWRVRDQWLPLRQRCSPEWGYRSRRNRHKLG